MPDLIDEILDSLKMVKYMAPDACMNDIEDIERKLKLIKVSFGQLTGNVEAA